MRWRGSHGTGYPNWFYCAKAREIYLSDSGEQARRRALHVVTLTGRTKPAPGKGKGHPRKSKTSREYRCSCGHVGWSCHIDLERMEQRQ